MNFKLRVRRSQRKVKYVPVTLKGGWKKDWTGYWKVSCSLQWSIPHGTTSFVKYPRYRLPNTHTHTQHTDSAWGFMSTILSPCSGSSLSLDCWVEFPVLSGALSTSAELTEYKTEREKYSEWDRQRERWIERERGRDTVCVLYRFTAIGYNSATFLQPSQLELYFSFCFRVAQLHKTSSVRFGPQARCRLHLQQLTPRTPPLSRTEGQNSLLHDWI